MTLDIRIASGVTPDQLAQLVADNLPRLLPDVDFTEDQVPRIGENCLQIETADRTILIAFEVEDGRKALVAGLEVLDDPDITGEPELLILSRFQPPGLRLLSRLPGLSWQSIRVLTVNGELGLLIEPVPQPHAARPPAPAAVVEPESTPAADPEDNLSEEEENYFQQL